MSDDSKWDGVPVMVPAAVLESDEFQNLTDVQAGTLIVMVYALFDEPPIRSREAFDELARRTAPKADPVGLKEICDHLWAEGWFELVPALGVQPSAPWHHHGLLN